MTALATANQHQPVIEAIALTKKFNDFTAVRQIDFSIAAQEIVCFLGPNGAGKTTTIKMIMGLLKITSGSVRILGLDGTAQRREIKGLMGYLSQKFSLYPLLNGYENMEFFAGISGLTSAKIRALRGELEELIPPAMLRLKVQDIPPGFRQKVALFITLVHDPQILLLDEPTSGVDPEVRREFWLEIYRLKRSGKTLLVSTHNLDEAVFADRVLIIHNGEIVVDGAVAEILQRSGQDSLEEVFRQAVLQHEIL